MKISIPIYIIFFCSVVYSQNIEWVTVPAGPYTWGENDESRSIDTDFEIMKYEVTNAQYIAYLREALAAEEITVAGDGVFGFYEGDSNWSAGNYEFYDIDDSENQIIWNGSDFEITSGFENYPVSEVTWFGANAYAMHHALRLPTEEEWEKAARGNTGFDYPWGDNISGINANFRDSGDPNDNGATPIGYFDGSNQNGYQTADSPSPYGAYDMAGNVWEWTNSPFDASTSARVLRGGSWFNPTISLQSWWRALGFQYDSDIFLGFRCINETTTNIDYNSQQPNKFKLQQNYPNPFNPSTIIDYAVGERGIVNIKIFDVLGSEISSLVNEEKSAGNYSLTFNAGNLPSGIYFYVLETGNFRATKKIILLR